MSNDMHLDEVKFHIPREREEAVWIKLCGVAIDVVENDDMRSGDIREMVEATGRTVGQLSLDELVRCWGWSLIREIADETDEIIDIDLEEDSSTDEETLFETLAPYVSAGSYIDLSGNSTGGPWQKRYGFTGKRVVGLEATFPPVPIE